MCRDRELPSFLSQVSARQVAMAAILVVSAISVLFFVARSR
jgi:amino acid permease